MRVLQFWPIMVLILAASVFSFVIMKPVVEPSQKLSVVTTTGMIADIIKNIGGDRVDVKSLMGAGVDPHLYKASEGDVNTLSEADMIFYNGLHLETKIGDILEKLGGRKKVVAVTDSIPRENLVQPQAFQGQYDPHVWFDVKMWMKAAEKARDELISFDAENKAYYQTMSADYLNRLEELNDYVKRESEKIPKEQRVLVTAHDAFNYFGKAYDFEVVGLQGISTESEAGTADVQNMVNFVVNRKIKAIFVESSVPQRTIEAVREASKSKGWNVEIGGQLFSDAMGDTGTFEGTYMGMVRHNIDTIVKSLGG